MLISSEIVLIFTELGIAELLKEMYIFTISLLDIIIQDSGIRKRSNVIYISIY